MALQDKIPVIGSTGSGGRRNYGKRTVALLGTTDFEFMLTSSANDITRFTEEILRQNPCFFVMHSGDGGVDEATGVIMKQNPHPPNTAVFLLKGGTANNLAEILRLSDVHYSARLARELASGKLNLEDYVNATDILKVTYDDDKTLYTVTSFNIGMVSQACYGAEKGGISAISNYFKRNGMKIITYTIESLKGAFRYHPIKAELTYDFGEEKKSFVLSDLLDMNIINGRKHAAIKEWNYKGNPCDGQLEVMCFKDMSILKMSRILGSMMLDQKRPYLSHYKEEDGYNPYGINYTENVKGLEIRILDQSKNKQLYLEMGGNAWPIEKPDSPIKAELIPGAINFVYGNRNK